MHNVHQRSHGGGQDAGGHAGLRELLVGLVKVVNHVFLAAEHLHDARAAYRFLHDAVQLAQTGLLLLEEPARALGHGAGNQQAHGDGDAADQRQLPAEPEHHIQAHDQRDHGGENLCDRVGQHAGDVVHVVGQAAHQLAVGR